MIPVRVRTGIGFLAASALVASATWVHGYCTLPTRWTGGRITLFHNFPSSGPLTNGTTSWGQNVASAMEEWNTVSAAFQFLYGGAGSAGASSNDGVNNMVFDDAVDGDSFGEDVLAITFTRSVGAADAVESDVIFNATVAWDAYGGSIRFGFDGRPIYDFRRVALHELGHVLGLDHPDDVCGQTVEAIMNMRTTDLDHLTPDDRSGLGFLYGGANQPPTADAGNDLAGSTAEPVVLNAGGSVDSDGEIVLYEWFEAGRLLARGRVARVSFNAGIHVVTLSVTDDQGAVGSDTVVVQIGTGPAPGANGNASPVARAGPDQIVQEDDPAFLDGSASYDRDGDINRYVWSIDTSVIGREAAVSITLPVGRHEIQLTVYDDRAAASTDSLEVTVIAAGSARPDPPTPPPAPPIIRRQPAMCGAVGLTGLAFAIVGLWSRRATPRR